MKCTLFIFCLFACVLKTWSQITIDKLPISLKDFSVKSGLSPNSFAAKTTFTYNSSFNFRKNKNITELYLSYEFIFDKENSWVKKEFLKTADASAKEKLLNHEKGHYIIGLIGFSKMQQALSAYTFSKRFKPEADSILHALRNEVDSLNKQYDLETDHSKIEPAQLAWEKSLMETLNTYYKGEPQLMLKFDIRKEIE